MADAVLKGADFDKTLVSKSPDGIRIAPIYPKAEGGGVPGRAAHAPWRVTQRMDQPDPAAANEQALADLAGGADSLVLLYEGAAGARGFGVAAHGIEDLERAFRGVMLDLIEIRLETAPFEGPAAAAQWIALSERQGLDPTTLSVDFGLDPIGDTARAGSAPAPWPVLAGRIAETTRRLREAGFKGPTVRVDTRIYHEAGASEGQELAAALATGVAYLRALDDAGHDLEAAREVLTFLVVADADQFLTIAKVRALRQLWSSVEEACGLPPRSLHLQAETAWRMVTRRDPWINLLRGTLAAFSAGIGGADAVTVLPFTIALGLPDAFARRLARNTQAILIEESNLWRVADPAAGSGALEALTGDLVTTGWRLFQEIEREGGIAASLAAGRLQERIAATRKARHHAVATRRQPITGTSEFPDLHELPVTVLAPCPRPHAPQDEQPAGSRSMLLPSLRDAEPFEELRDRSDAILAATGVRPRMFLATLGPLSAFSARAAFARNLFEAGGIEAVALEGADTPEALAQAFASSGARLACLCSSDAIYAEQGPAAAAALKQAGVALLHLAGRPGDLVEPFRAAGVDGYIHIGTNLLITLNAAYEILERGPSTPT